MYKINNQPISEKELLDLFEEHCLPTLSANFDWDHRDRDEVSTERTIIRACVDQMPVLYRRLTSPQKALFSEFGEEGWLEDKEEEYNALMSNTTPQETPTKHGRRPSNSLTGVSRTVSVDRYGHQANTIEAGRGGVKSVQRLPERAATTGGILETNKDEQPTSSSEMHTTDDGSAGVHSTPSNYPHAENGGPLDDQEHPDETLHAMANDNPPGPGLSVRFKEPSPVSNSSSAVDVDSGGSEEAKDLSQPANEAVLLGHEQPGENVSFAPITSDPSVSIQYDFLPRRVEQGLVEAATGSELAESDNISEIPAVPVWTDDPLVASDRAQPFGEIYPEVSVYDKELVDVLRREVGYNTSTSSSPLERVDEEDPVTLSKGKERHADNNPDDLHPDERTPGNIDSWSDLIDVDAAEVVEKEDPSSEEVRPVLGKEDGGSTHKKKKSSKPTEPSRFYRKTLHDKFNSALVLSLLGTEGWETKYEHEAMRAILNSMTDILLKVQEDLRQSFLHKNKARLKVAAVCLREIDKLALAGFVASYGL